MIVLASASPRRRELLALIEPAFDVVPSSVDETAGVPDPAQRVQRLAEKKAKHVAHGRKHDIVIGADTVVWVCGRILEKPRDSADAKRMIRLLSGRTHTVYTGVCVISGGVAAEHCATDVTFDPLTEEEIDEYIRTEQVMDKAGAYAIQGAAARFVRGVDGCFFNVMGLPVNLLYHMLKRAGPEG
jgi:septum formation protein